MQPNLPNNRPIPSCDSFRTRMWAHTTALVSHDSDPAYETRSRMWSLLLEDGSVDHLSRGEKTKLCSCWRTVLHLRATVRGESVSTIVLKQCVCTWCRTWWE
jgi:hypothetical protein